MLLLARWAGPTGFGTVGIALSIVVVLQTATDLGVSLYVLKERAAEPLNPTIRRALEINNFTARIMALLLFLVFLGAGFGVQALFLELLPLAVWAAADRNTDTWCCVRLADGDAWLNTLTTLSRRGCSALVMVGLYLAGVDPLLAFSLSVAVVGVIVNLLVHGWVVKRLAPPAVPRPAAKPIILASVPYWINATATQLRNLDSLLVGLLAGSAQVGFYAVASKLTGPLRMLPTSLAAVVLPTASRLGVHRLGPLVKPTAAVLGMMSLIYAVVGITAGWTVPLFLGSDFAGAVVPLQIICGGLIFAACASNLSAILQGVGRGASVARIAVITTVCCLGGVVVGTLLLDAVGAAIALACSFVLQAALLGRTLINERHRTAVPQ